MLQDQIFFGLYSFGFGDVCSSTERSEIRQNVPSTFICLQHQKSSVTGRKRSEIANKQIRINGGNVAVCRSQWPRGLRRGSTAARLLGLWVRIPPRAWMSVSCECCVLSCRGLCDGLVPRPEESYRLWCV